MKKSVFVVFTALVLALPLSAAPKRLTFGTGSSGGNFYVVGAGLANTINNLFPKRFSVTAEETGGGTANLSLIESGEADFGIAMASSIEQGLDGTAAWAKGKKMKNVRGLIPLYPSLLTIYALDSNPVKNLSDFKGRKIGLGSKGAAMDNVFRELLPKLGYEPGDIFNDGHGATATAVSNGTIDAALLFSLPPFPAIAQLEASKNLRFIGLTAEEQKFFTDAYGFYKAAVLPKDSYKGVSEDLPVISEWNFAVVSAKLSTKDVYDIAKALFENNPKLLQIYKGLSYATTDNALAFNLPLHPGVIKYLEEKGIKVPKELRP